MDQVVKYQNRHTVFCSRRAEDLILEDLQTRKFLSFFSVVLIFNYIFSYEKVLITFHYTTRIIQTLVQRIEDYTVIHLHVLQRLVVQVVQVPLMVSVEEGLRKFPRFCGHYPGRYPDCRDFHKIYKANLQRTRFPDSRILFRILEYLSSRVPL